MDIYARLQELGIELAPVPPASGAYAPWALGRIERIGIGKGTAAVLFGKGGGARKRMVANTDKVGVRKCLDDVGVYGGDHSAPDNAKAVAHFAVDFGRSDFFHSNSPWIRGEDLKRADRLAGKPMAGGCSLGHFEN